MWTRDAYKFEIKFRLQAKITPIKIPNLKPKLSYMTITLSNNTTIYCTDAKFTRS